MCELWKWGCIKKGGCTKGEMWKWGGSAEAAYMVIFSGFSINVLLSLILSK